MGLLSQFEDRAESIIEGKPRSGLKLGAIAKLAAKEMQRECMVGSTAKYAPTLYNVLISSQDNQEIGVRLQRLGTELEDYLTQAAAQKKLTLDCTPLVRFIEDAGLRRGRFDVIAENVSPAIIEQLRDEEIDHYAAMGASATPEAEEPAASALVNNDIFDPFVPSDMQSAVYVPLDVPEPMPAVTLESMDEYERQEEELQVPEPEESYDQDLYEEEPYQEDPADWEEPVDEEPAAETVIMAAAAAPAVAYLTDVMTRKRYTLSSDVTVIGRETDCHISICDPGISRHHGRITRQDGAWLLQDTNSTNGTMVNGNNVTQCQLKHGDRIELGESLLVFQEG